MATTPNRPKASTPSASPTKARRNLPAPSKGLTKDDYLYALEVAGQPATSAADKAMKRQAKANMKYLEAKFPKYTARVKDFGTRINMPTHTGNFTAGGKTRAGKMSSSRGSMKAE